jgi:hypothetical protein
METLQISQICTPWFYPVHGIEPFFVKKNVAWDLCCDLNNIFTEISGEKLTFLTKILLGYAKIDHMIGFLEKR